MEGRMQYTVTWHVRLNVGYVPFRRACHVTDELLTRKWTIGPEF